MEPGQVCWTTLSSLSRRGGKAPEWILSKKKFPREPRGRRAGKQGKGGPVKAFMRSKGFLRSKMICFVCKTKLFASTNMSGN